jgi:hypothetical protein
LRQAQQKEATQKHGISEEMIASIGALRDCRIFVSDDVVRSIAGGARSPRRRPARGGQWPVA